MKSPQVAAPWLYSAIAVAGSLTIAVAAAFVLSPHGQAWRPSGPTAALLLTLAAVAAWAWAGVFTWLYWRRLDEAAKEAQKFAWFFGGLLGMVATAPLVIYIRLVGAPAFVTFFAEAHPGPGVFFALGWISLALAETAGFLLVWAGWWWARR